MSTPSPRTSFASPPPNSPLPGSTRFCDGVSHFVVIPTLSPEQIQEEENKIKEFLKPVTLYDGVPPLPNMTPRDWAARELYTTEIQYQQNLSYLCEVQGNY